MVSLRRVLELLCDVAVEFHDFLEGVLCRFDM